MRSFSPSLGREITADIYRPQNLTKQDYPLLILNDGQDAESLQLREQIENLWQRDLINPVLVAAIHAGDRMQEYGISSEPDFDNRGSKAGEYEKFLINEFIPYLKSKYPLQSHS